MPLTLASPAPTAAVARPSALPAAPARPVLRLRRVPIDAGAATGGRLDLDAWPGELLHLGGGSHVQRLMLLRLAAGLARPLHGQCRVLGQDTGVHTGVRTAGIPHLPRWPAHMLRHVLHDEALPAQLSVPDFVAQPLLADGLDAAQARTRAELELYLLGASRLRQRRPESLSMLEARQVRLAHATVARPALLVLAWPDRGLGADAARALRLVLTTLACTFGSCVLLTSDDPRLQASADRHIDLDRAN